MKDRCLVLVTALLLILLPAVVQAQWTYETNTENTVTITGYDCSSNAVTVPGTLGGLQVTIIGQDAFYGCLNLTSVVISNGVTEIGGYAFASCANLTSLLIPASLTTNGFGIQYDAFYQDTNLTVTIYGNGYIGSDAFQDRADLTSVIISNGVTEIDGYAFASCPNLTSLLIPASLTTNGFAIQYDAFYQDTNLTVTIYGNGYIGSDAFQDRADLTSVIISNGVTEINGYAFASCPNLTSLLIPASVNSIGYEAFEGCAGLTNISVAAANIYYTSVAGVLFDKSQDTLIQCPGGKSGAYTIPTSITSIDDGAFDDCFGLTAIYFQGNAPGLGSSVFNGDNNLTVYYLPGTTGWGATFGGVPVVCWNPQAQGLGVQTNQFGFTITGSSNLVIVVEASTNLANPVWVPVSTNTLTGGASYFSDPQWTNTPSRFYRFRSP